MSKERATPVDRRLVAMQERIEELEAELRTRDNAEATHRITLRGVQAETMRVQTQCDDLQFEVAELVAFMRDVARNTSDHTTTDVIDEYLAKVRKP